MFSIQPRSFFVLQRTTIMREWRRAMSTRPRTEADGSAGLPKSRKKVTIETLRTQREAGIPITMLTAYDYSTALACSANPKIDITLVGDSLAQVCLGYHSTTQLTLSEMIHHTKAVARGTSHPLLVADMPFGTYHTSVSDAIANAVRMVQEGHVEAVKMEGGREIAEVVRGLTRMGIPVMGHVGLLPQRHVALSGFKVQGRGSERAKEILEDALILEEAGAFSMVVEAVPQELGTQITRELKIPTIGIGAGPHTNGQVLVWDDVMGTWSGHKPKFVRRFADIGAVRAAGVESYAEAVRTGSFPNSDTESYS